MRRLWVLIVVGIFAALTMPQGAYSQAPTTNEEVMSTIQQLRNQIESQQQQLQQLEGVLQQRVKESEQRVESTIEKTLKRVQLQPPQALLGPPAMPPAAVKPALGLFANVELHGINFWGVETPFASVRPPSGEIPRGPWATVDVSRDFTARPTLGFYLPSGAGKISASFYTLQTIDSASFSNSDRIVGAGNMGVFDENDIIEARARLKLNVTQFDLQYQYPIKVTRIFTLTPEFGLRGINFRHDVKLLTWDDIGDFVMRTTWKSKSEGWGPKIALTGTWALLDGLSLSAQAGGGYLLGTNNAKQECRGEEACASPTNWPVSSLEEHRGFPFVEGDLALKYAFPEKSPLRGLSVGAGYRVGTYIDLFTRLRDVVAFEPRTNLFEQRNVSYDSIYGKIQYLF